MHLWQNLGAGQNGKTQEVCISGNSHDVTAAMLVLATDEPFIYFEKRVFFVRKAFLSFDFFETTMDMSTMKNRL